MFRTSLWHAHLGLSEPWCAAIEEAWVAYCGGSLPVGAAIVDEHGHIVARGRNRIYETSAEGTHIYGSRVAHAEMNALFALGNDRVNPAGCTVYTTLEPCPMCLGAIRISMIPEVRYLCCDAVIEGATEAIMGAPFMRGKVTLSRMADTGVADVLEIILLAWLTDLVLRLNDARMVRLLGVRANYCPEGVQLGRALFDSGELAAWGARSMPAGEVVDRLLVRLGRE